MSTLTVPIMTEQDARRLTERIRIAAVNYSEAKDKLMGLVQEAKDGSAHIALVYDSWQAYLADTLGDEPMRIARSDRPELVQLLTEQGMSTRATAAVMGISHMQVSRDLRGSTVTNVPVDEARISHGLDGKTRIHQPRTQPKPEPVTARPDPVPTQFTAVVVDLNRDIAKLQRITESGNYRNNLDAIAEMHASDITRAINTLQAILKTLS